MFHKMIGLVGVLVLAGAAPASACNTGCGPQPAVVYGVAKTWVAPPQPRYYVNHGPTYTGPATLAPVPVYQERGVTGHYPYVSSYPQPYTGGPYANPYNHYSYGVSPNQGPVVLRYHNLPRTYAPVRRYSAVPLHYRPAPRYRSAPRYYAPRYRAAPRYHAAPRYRVAPVYRAAPRYGVAPRYQVAPRYRAAPRYGYRAPVYAPRAVHGPRVHPASRQFAPRPHVQRSAPRYHAGAPAPRPRAAPPRYLN